MLTATQIQSYRDDGYLLVADVIAPDVVAKARLKLAELIEASRRVSASDGRSTGEGRMKSADRLLLASAGGAMNPSLNAGHVLPAPSLGPQRRSPLHGGPSLSSIMVLDSAHHARDLRLELHQRLDTRTLVVVGGC